MDGGVRSACLALLVVILAAGGPARAQSFAGARRWLASKPTGDSLNALWGDADAIVAVGDGGTILRSTDHGASWALIVSGTAADLHAIWGAGPRDFWAVGGGGAILHSADGGVHWQQVRAAEVTADLTGVWARGPNDVVASADAGQVVHTHDGGRSFQVVRPLGQTDELFTGVWGSAADDLYVVGDRGSVLASTDSGSHWEVRQKQTPRLLARGPDPPKGANSIGGSRIYGVTGLARGELLLAPISWIRTRKVNDSGAGLARLIDAGRIWKPVSIAPRQSHYAAYRAFFTRGDGVVYGVTDFEFETPAQPQRAGLIVSTDGGATFERRSVFEVESGSPKALWRDPAGPLIAVGWGGAMLRSLDDGRTWVDLRVHPLGRAAWRAIWTDGAREVWIAGWKCAVLHSVDGGTHFEAIALPCSATQPARARPDLSAVWGSGPDDVYLAGARVYHTTDRGKSWADVTPPSSVASDWSVWGSDAGDVYAVGNGIWRSIDRGRTWKRIDEAPSNGRAESFSQIVGFSRADLYVVRRFGQTILHSIDGGATWESRRSASPFDGCCDLRAMMGASEIFAVGAHHAFFRSGDGGRTWDKLVTPLGPYTRFDAMILHRGALFVLAADAEDRGQHTSLLRSLDHGATWQLHSKLPYGMNGLAAIGDDLLAAGWDGIVLRLVGAASSARPVGR